MIALALLFLVVASIAIIGGEIDLTVEPEKTGPYLRVVHAVDGVEALDVYVDDKRVARDLDFRESSDFDTWEAGRYDVAVYNAGADRAAEEPLVEETITLDAGESVSLVAVGRSGTPGVTLVAASEDIAYIDDSDAVRVIAVNGLTDRPAVDVRDETSGTTVVDGLAYGQASEAVEINAGTRTIGLHPSGDSQTRLAVLDSEELEANTSRLWVFTEARQPDNSFVDVVINLETEARPTFGSPAHVGQLLYTRYVLPFEMVALLLLVAMIGAIVLTHETLSTRRPMVRRLANPQAGLDQPIIGESSK